MGSNCCKGDAAGKPVVRSNSSIYTRSRAGATLDDRFRTSVDAGGVRLTVSSAQIGDSGVYTLQASNAAGKDTTRVSLEVSADETPTGDDPPTFLRRLQDLTVKVGTRTRFLVEILSSTECKVTWYRNERRLLEAERIALVRDGNFWCADIAAVSVDDAGRWTCTAENLGGRASCSAHLNVLVPKAYKRPEFVEELRAILTEHGTVSLECKVVGVPTPVLRWFKDSREIKAGDVFALTANADDPTSLGTYTCEAINCMGRAYSSSKVHVVGRSKEGSDKPSFGGMTPDPPPIFTKELEDQFVRICDHLSLGCQIVVPPWPRSVIWYNKEGKIDPSTKYHIIEDGVGGYMIEVSASEWADEGEWKCVATSVGGRVGISTCSVTMDVPKNYRKPRFMENLQAVLTEEGLVSFECKVVGFPTPVLSWFKDGQELKPGDVYQLTGTNSLGSYCCIARNCMGQASSSAELTVEDIQNQLNEEEKLQLFSKNQAPKFLQGLKSVEVKIEEPFRFTIKVVVPPEPTVLWYRDDQPIDESPRCHLGQEERGVFYLDIKNLELIDQTEWKCVAMNDYGHSVTSCFLKLIIPRHYKKPRFLENLQAILSDEGAVNLECKVIGVPQPVLKWYKDGEELKPGDIHRIISGQDGTCCLGTYTCEAQNCMGIAASSASLLGFEDTVKAKKKRADDQILQRNLSLSTIHEERTSQMYDTPIADVTLDEKGEISFSFDGKEVSVSLYETPDLTEEEALQIVEMYADQLSENVTEHNVIELPPLRFVKETSTSGNLLMEAVIIDVSPDYFVSPEEDLRTEADIEDISIAEENGQAQLSFDQEVGDEYIEKTMALLSEEKADIPSKPVRRKSDSQKSGEDFFSLSREQSLSEEKRDDDTQMLSESVSFASAHSIEKQKSKPSQEDEIGTQESSDVTKTVLLREDIRTSLDIENKDSKRISSTKRDSLKSTTSFKLNEADITNLNENIVLINSSISKILNRIQILERDIILKSQLSSTAAIATKSLEIINSIVNPLTEIHSITDAFKETISDSSHAEPILFDNLPQSLKNLQNSLAMVEKCIDVGSDKTLINNTCINIVNNCAEDIIKFVAKLKEIPEVYPSLLEAVVSSEIELVTGDILNLIDVSKSTVSTKYNYNQEIKNEELSIDKRHLNNTQKAIYNLKVPVNSLLDIIENALNKSPLSPDEINNAEVILFNMSSSIQDLQTALEHIEFLSVEETNSSLEKYNTTTIETVIGSVLKLRNSFESLSFEKERKYDKEQLQSVLHVIKVDLQEIASHIDNIEKKIGQFDVLYGDNKLEILQRMAHILISLENNLPLLNSLPNVQKIVTTFHKHLTKALEIVIESNESVKYCTFLRICDVVSRINVSIKGLESRKYLSLTSIGNNLSIIEDILKHHSIDEDVSEEILKSINQYYVDIPNVIAVYADENSVKLDSEPVEDISIDKFYTESKANVVVQQIDQVIAVINNISPDEIAPNLCHILPVLQNTCPVLEELKYHIASLDENIQGNSHVSDISQSSIEQSFGKPLQAMQENIIVLNQVLLETIGEVNSKDDARIAFAKPLYELYTTLQTLQENIISQYESFSLTEHSEKIAKSVEVLQNCILIVEEQCDIEVVDEMSTSQDISCIKTTADAFSDNNLISPMSEEIMVHAPIVNHLEIQPKIAHEFQLLHNDILEIQKVDILEALNSLSEVKEYANIKSVTETIEEIQHKIVSILSPLVMESLSSVSNLDLASTNLTDISESLLKLKNHLTVIDVDNIPIYEDVLKIPSSKIHSIVKNIANIKEHLDKCILLVQQSTYAIDSKEMQDLRNICDNFKFLMRTVQTDILHDQTILNLVNAVENFLRVIEINPDLKSLDVISVSKDLYQHVMIVEDTILQFIAPTNFTPQPLEETIHKLACSLAVLEHCNFELFGELNEHYPEYISEIFKETEYLNDMENVIQNKIITIQDTSCQTLKTESQKTELLLLQNFFENCKNSFSIIGIILKQRPSQKKIIRLIQEFFALQVIINNFKDKQSMLICNPEFLTCLDIFLNQAEGNIVKIKTSIIKISKSLSNTLFKEPLNKINDCLESFPNYLKLDSMLELHDLIQNFLISISIAAPHLENLEQNVIKELEESMFINTNVENKLIIDSLENFLSFLEREMCDNPSKQKELLLKEMIKCFKNHQDYKNAVGTGKRMIILKCLADSSDILRKTFINVYPETKIVERRQPDSLENALTELKELLEALNLEINKIQENSGVIRSTPIDQVLDLSLKNIMSSKESCEKLVEGNGETSVCENNISLINDVIQEIHIIQDTMNTLQCDSSIMFKNLKEIENFVSKILPNNEETDNRKFSKGKPRSLLQHVEQYIEVTEIIEEISAIVNLGTVKETKEIAQELRESLAADDTLTLNASEEFKYCTVSENQENLAQLLQKSLSNIQESDLTACENTVREHVLEVISQLQDDLKTIASSDVSDQHSVNIDLLDNNALSMKKDNTTLEVTQAELCQNNDVESSNSGTPVKNQPDNAELLIHQIEDTISCICNMTVEEIPSEIKNIYPVLENICPILEELKLNIASIQENFERTESPVSDISEILVEKAFSKPFQELEENISILNQIILETFKDIAVNEQVGVLAKSLHELHVTYQILQQNVMSQYESFSSLNTNVNFAATEQILHNCVLLVQQPYEVEVADEISTLEDISGIKTTANSISSDIAIAQETQVTTQENIEDNKLQFDLIKLSDSIEVQETEAVSEENVSSSMELPLYPNPEITRETTDSMGGHIQNKINDSPEVLRQCVEPAQEVTPTDQVAIEKSGQRTGDQVSGLTEQLNTTVQTITEEIPPVSEHVETSEIKISPTRELLLKPECEYTEDTTLNEDIKTNGTDSSKILNESVDPVENALLKIQSPTENCIEQKEENIAELSELPIISEQANAQETQSTLKEYIAANEIKTFSACEQETMITIDKDIETKLEESSEINDTYFDPEEDTAPKLHIPTEKCIERNEENISQLIQQPNICEKAIVEEVQSNLEEHFETSETKTSSLEQSLEPENAIVREITTPIDEDIKNNLDNSYERSEENIVDVIEQSITDQANAQENQGTLKDSTEISENKNISSYEEPFKLDKAMETSSVGDAQKINLPTEKCIEKREENISYLIEQANLSEKAIVKETQSNLEEYIETTETTLFSSHEQLFKPESEIEQDKAISIDEDIEKKVEISPELIARSESEEDASVIVQVSTEKTIERSVEDVFQHTEQPMAPIKESIAQETKDTPKELNETNEVNISKPNQEIKDPMMAQDSSETNSLLEKISSATKRNEIQPTREIPNMPMDNSNIILCETNLELENNNIIQGMDSLINELHDKLNSATVINIDTADSLQNILDELQVQIIKLKSVNIKDASDTLNETVEDLECSVRSVQLLVTENSPADHITEASATIKLLVNAIKEDLSIMPLQDATKTKTDILEDCVGDTETTLLLLDKASQSTIDSDDILKILSNLNCVKDSINRIKLSFSVNEETVIEQGIEIMQSLDVIEQQLFTIESDLAQISKINSHTRDTIVTAVHSVYTNISNIRGTISSIQKRYIYQNYAKPSENLLKAIKNINFIKNIDSKKDWMLVAKHFRNILNHFEEIKFYINLDKTARQPCDTSLTKVVLNELRLLLSSVVLTNIKELKLPLDNSVDLTIKYVEDCLQNIDHTPTIEVREKIPIFKGLTAKLLELTSDMLHEYEKHKNDCSLNLNESQNEQISTSFPQYTLEEQTTLEIPKTSHEGETNLNSISAPKISSITNESPPFENCAHFTEDNVEKKMWVKESVQPIIEHLIEEATNVILLRKLKDENIEGLEEKDDYENSFLHATSDQFGHEFLDEIERKIQTNSSIIEGPVETVENQNVVEVNDLKLGSGNMLRDEEEILILDETLQLTETVTEDICNNKVTQSHEDEIDINKSSIYKLEKMLQNSNDENNICQIDYDESLINQNKVLDFKDEAKTKENQEIKPLSAFKPPEEQEEKLINNNKVELGNQESDNRKEDSFVLKKGENEQKRDSLTVNDPVTSSKYDNQLTEQEETQTHDEILIEEQVPLNVDIQEKSQIKDTLNSKIGKTLNQESKQETEIDDVQFGMKIEEKESILFEANREHTTVRNEVDEKCNFIDNKLSDMESNDYHNKNETRIEQEFNTSDTVIRNVVDMKEVTKEKIEFTEKEAQFLYDEKPDNKISFTEQCHNFIPEDHDRKQHETENSFSVNETSESLQHELDVSLEKLDKGIQKTISESIIEGKTEDPVDQPPQKIKVETPVILNHQQPVSIEYLNLNKSKGEMTISSVQVEILTAIVSEQEKQTNLDELSVPNIEDNLVTANEHKETPIESQEKVPETENSTSILENRYEIIEGINKISQSDKADLLSEEQKFNPSLLDQDPCLEIHNKKGAEPENHQQNMEYETKDTVQPINIEPIDTFTAQKGLESSSIDPPTTMENKISENEQSRQEQVRSHETMIVKDVITEFGASLSQPESKDLIISNDENNRSTLTLEQKKFIPMEVDNQNINDTEPSTLREINENNHRETDRPLLEKQDDGETRQNDPLASIKSLHIELISEQNLDRESIDLSTQNYDSVSDKQYKSSQEENKKINESKLETNGLSKRLKSKSLKSKPDAVEDDNKKNNGKYRSEDTEITRQKRQEQTDVQKTDNIIDEQNTETSDHLSMQILDSNVYDTFNKTQSNNMHTELDKSLWSKDINTAPNDVKEKPHFNDTNLVDSSMEFLRPPGYIPKSFPADNLLSPETDTYVSTSNKFYKAQSLVRDNLPKTKYTPDHDRCLSKDKQLGLKATSESRSINYDKRTSSARDLKRKPAFTTHLTNRTAVEGSRVKLTCSVLSSTEPVMNWYKNGILLDDKHKYKIKFNDGLITMELLNALPGDSGDYSCTVENEHGSITTSAKLKVYPSFEASPIPPTFTRSIRDIYHRAENELVLECRIRGQPLPIISWFKNNQLIVTDERYQASYLADGLCRLTINKPTKEDSGTYTCKAESAAWSDQITHYVNFDDPGSRLDSHISSVERLRLSHDTRRPHFTNVLSDDKVPKGGTIGLQVEIGGAPTRVEWLREGSSVTELDKNAQTFVDHGTYMLALSDVSELHSGLYTCRAWSKQGSVDMNAEISVVQPNEVDGKPPVIVSRPPKDVHISVGEDVNISFRVQGEPKPKVFIMKGIRDITNSQRVCKMTSDDYVKFTLKRSVISDAGTYCILARNVYGCDRAFVTVAVRQRASSDNLISDWTYPADGSSIVATDRKYKSVPGRIPGEPSAVDGGNNWITLAWPKSDPQEAAPILAYRVDSWLLGKEGGARWVEMGITPRTTFDAFNLKQGEEYHFRVTPRNRYGWGEPVQTSTPIGVGIAGDRPEFIDILPGLLKVLVGETASLSCSFKGKPTPEIVWMKNGREIEESSKFRSRQSGNVCSLTIRNVETEDEGRYSCEATNAHGRSSTYARMTVITDRHVWEADAKLKRERSADATGEYPPQFTMRLRDRRVQATYPVRLTCQVIGSPKPNVTWFKDGQEIIFDTRKTQYQDEHFHTLEIAPTMLDDGGLYEALARNNSGAVSCRCNLVVDKGIRAYVAPEFCCGLEPLYRLNEGDELRVSAIVEAYPSVGVTWYRDGVRLRPSRRAIMTLDRDGQIELALASVTPRDAGVYTCTASNEVGQASTSGKVEIVTDQREERRNLPTVICPDVPYSKEPMFIKKPRSTEAQEGDTVIIECEVIGDPTPEVYWLRDFLKPDYYRDAKHFKQLAAGPLYRFEIPHAKLDYTGAYSVVARNIHGEAKAIISLQIFAKDLRSNDETHNIRYGRVEVIPRFEKELTDLLCYDGDAIEFECHVSGNPEPDIRWFHYNQILPDCPDFESTYDLGTARLKIKQVAAEDEGTYTCEASNNLGKATSTACLVVYPPGEPNTLSQRLQRPPTLASAASTPRSTPRVTPARSMSRTPARSGPDSRRSRSPTREVGPKFYTYPYNKVVEEGDSVILQCAVGGFPTPWASWDKDGIIITPTSRISIKEKDDMLRILQIDEVNVDDVGLYRITLENDFGRAEASARLEVISHKGKFHSRSSSVSPARLHRRRTPSFTRQD